MAVTSFLIFVIVSSFTPGPNNIMAMALSNQHGYKKTKRFCFGVACGFFLIVIISSLFNLVFTEIMPMIEVPLSMIGVGYMLYLAYKMLRSKDHGSENQQPVKKQFLLGVLLQFINPKGILFGMTVVATFILPYYDSYWSYFLFALLLGAVGFASTSTWSLLGSMLQKFLNKYRKPFNIVMAGLLAFSAISMIVQ